MKRTGFGHQSCTQGPVRAIPARVPGWELRGMDGGENGEGSGDERGLPRKSFTKGV